MKRRFQVGFLVSAIGGLLLCALAISLDGCTTAQVDQSVDAANHVIAATKQPVVDDLGQLPQVGPYVKLAAQLISDIAYEAVRVLDALKPNAGEPTTRPTAMIPPDRTNPGNVPRLVVVSR